MNYLDFYQSLALYRAKLTKFGRFIFLFIIRKIAISEKGIDITRHDQLLSRDKLLTDKLTLQGFLQSRLM
jgi:hypothetical protein